MELVAAVAIGLNPYVGTLVLAALAAYTDRLPPGDLLAAVPPAVLGAAALAAGLAAPADFVLGKFLRFAPQARRLSQLAAPAAGALFATSVSQSDLPLPVVAATTALLSWSVAVMLTAACARASRSPAWVGLGHVPVLMGAATAAACIVPLGVALPGLGFGLVAATLSVLLWVTLAAGRAGRPAPARPAAPRAAALADRLPVR